MSQNLITKPLLEIFIRELERGRLINPLPIERVSTNVAVLTHRQGIEAHLNHPEINISDLLRWCKNKYTDLQNVELNRQSTRNETQLVIYPMEFFPVPKGKFKSRQYDNSVIEISISQPFEMMSTPVTQSQWIEIMGVNPSHFFDKNDPSKTLNHPVENITWYSALEFANRLSERHGYPLSYDLTHFRAKPGTTAENGTLSTPDSLDIDADIKYNSITDTSTDLKGYRLPTDAEQQYILMALGARNLKDHYFGDDETELSQHAWYRENAESTQAVAQLAPLWIEGEPFYDLLGNVIEWTQPIDLPGTILNRKTYGGSWAGKWNVSAVNSYNPIPNERNSEIGFRLVRTIR